jgi:hypothetical protein
LAGGFLVRQYFQSTMPQTSDSKIANVIKSSSIREEQGDAYSGDSYAAGEELTQFDSSAASINTSTDHKE